MTRLETLPSSEQVVEAMFRIDAFWTMAEVPAMKVSEGLMDLPVINGSIELRLPQHDHEPTTVTFKRFPQQDVTISRHAHDSRWTVMGEPGPRAVRQAATMASLLTMSDLATMEYLNERMLRTGLMPSFEFTDMLLRKKFYMRQGETT